MARFRCLFADLPVIDGVVRTLVIAPERARVVAAIDRVLSRDFYRPKRPVSSSTVSHLVRSLELPSIIRRSSER